jgi:hypothetical protein
MKQIKTIAHRMDNADLFDEAVNAALAEGWQLTKREVINPMAQSEKLLAYVTIYAELEREVITEKEQTCDNCKHLENRADQEPCLSCNENCSHWEAMP